MNTNYLEHQFLQVRSVSPMTSQPNESVQGAQIQANNTYYENCTNFELNAKTEELARIIESFYAGLPVDQQPTDRIRSPQKEFQTFEQDNLPTNTSPLRIKQTQVISKPPIHSTYQPSGQRQFSNNLSRSRSAPYLKSSKSNSRQSLNLHKQKDSNHGDQLIESPHEVKIENQENLPPLRQSYVNGDANKITSLRRQLNKAKDIVRQFVTLQNEINQLKVAQNDKGSGLIQIHKKYEQEHTQLKLDFEFKLSQTQEQLKQSQNANQLLVEQLQTKDLELEQAAGYITDLKAKVRDKKPDSFITNNFQSKKSSRIGSASSKSPVRSAINLEYRQFKSVPEKEPLTSRRESLVQKTLLEERCLKLERYCRELIETNKILDCENRIAIAQLTSAFNANELQSLVQNMQTLGQQSSQKVLSKVPMAYEKQNKRPLLRNNQAQHQSNSQLHQKNSPLNRCQTSKLSVDQAVQALMIKYKYIQLKKIFVRSNNDESPYKLIQQGKVEKKIYLKMITGVLSVKTGEGFIEFKNFLELNKYL